MKKIKLTEEDLSRIVKKVIAESEFSLEPYDTEYPRESGIKGIFGKYTPEVPNDVIRYMRKNPRLIFDRLFFEYGDKAFEYLEMAREKYTRGA
jgi:hypothetical protein